MRYPVAKRALLSFLASLSVVVLASCDAPPLEPADPGPSTACRSCRMPVSDVRFASQIVAPGREPQFFDDFSCLRGYLRNGTNVPAEFTVYVADHRTKEWVRADAAVFTKVDGIDTPMGSGIVAHEDQQSRDADPTARGGEAVPVSEIVPVAVRTRDMP